LFDVDGPAGDLARYTTAPSSAVNPTYVYYSGHGDLAAEADQSGARTAMLKLDAFGVPITTVSATNTQELFTGRWDKKLDPATSLIEMGARPYDPQIGRFYSPDPVDGGSCNEYDYTCQDPVNGYELTGKAVGPPVGPNDCSTFNLEACGFKSGRLLPYITAGGRGILVHSGSIGEVAGWMSLGAYATCPIPFLAGVGCAVGGGLGAVSTVAFTANAAYKCKTQGGSHGCQDAAFNAALAVGGGVAVGRLGKNAPKSRGMTTINSLGVGVNSVFIAMLYTSARSSFGGW
jgi:RHS repeat-associated protein